MVVNEGQKNLVDVTKFFSNAIDTMDNIKGMTAFIHVYYPDKIFTNATGKLVILVKDLDNIEEEYCKFQNLENNKRKEEKRNEKEKK